VFAVKKGWKVKNLGDLCQVIGGGTPSKDRAEYYIGRNPWATVRDMRSEVITETECKITLAAVKDSATKSCAEAVMWFIATRVGLGQGLPAWTRHRHQPRPSRYCSNRSERSFGALFFFWWLKGTADLIVAEGTGATVQGVKLPFVKSLQVPLPSLPNNSGYVGILDKAFDGIGHRPQANAKEPPKMPANCLKATCKLFFHSVVEGWVENSIAQCFKVRSGDFLPAKAMVATGSIDVYGGNGIIGKHDQKICQARTLSSESWREMRKCSARDGVISG